MLTYYVWSLHVFKIDPIIDTIENKQEEESPWSWEEYLDLYSAAYPSCQREEDEFYLAYYDEMDFDPALFLNASFPWIPR